MCEYELEHEGCDLEHEGFEEALECGWNLGYEWHYARILLVAPMLEGCWFFCTCEACDAAPSGVSPSGEWCVRGHSLSDLYAYTKARFN
jgi:hypothetical protein